MPLIEMIALHEITYTYYYASINASNRGSIEPGEPGLACSNPADTSNYELGLGPNLILIF